MDAAASKQVAEGFLKGFSDVIGAMLSTAPVFLASEPEEGDAGVLRDLLAETPFLVESALSGGGAVLLLTALGDARRIVSAVKGEPAAAAPGCPWHRRRTPSSPTRIPNKSLPGSPARYLEKASTPWQRIRRRPWRCCSPSRTHDFSAKWRKNTPGPSKPPCGPSLGPVQSPCLSGKASVTDGLPISVNSSS